MDKAVQVGPSFINQQPPELEGVPDFFSQVTEAFPPPPTIGLGTALMKSTAKGLWAEDHVPPGYRGAYMVHTLDSVEAKASLIEDGYYVRPEVERALNSCLARWVSPGFIANGLAEDGPANLTTDDIVVTCLLTALRDLGARVSNEDSEGLPLEYSPEAGPSSPLFMRKTSAAGATRIASNPEPTEDLLRDIFCGAHVRVKDDGYLYRQLLATSHQYSLGHHTAFFHTHRNCFALEACLSAAPQVVPEEVLDAAGPALPVPPQAQAEGDFEIPGVFGGAMLVGRSRFGEDAGTWLQVGANPRDTMSNAVLAAFSALAPDQEYLEDTIPHMVTTKVHLETGYNISAGGASARTQGPNAVRIIPTRRPEIV